MGAWGPGPFDNDAAVAWVAELSERGVAAIAAAFDAAAAVGDGYVDAEVGAAAVAAAETVARWRHEVTTGHAAVDAWLAGREDPPPDDLVDTAVAVVDRVTRPPSALWGGRDGDAEWRAVMVTLREWLTTTELASQGVIPAGWAGITPNEQPVHSPLSVDEQRLTRRDQALLKALRRAGVDLARPRRFLQHLYFTEQADADAAADHARAEGWDVEVTPPGATMVAWSVIASGDDVLIDADHIARSTAFFDDLAHAHNGLNDGWEVPVADERA